MLYINNFISKYIVVIVVLDKKIVFENIQLFSYFDYHVEKNYSVNNKIL